MAKPPTVVLLPALVLWGWQAGLLPWAIGMGLLLEVPRLVRSRVDISPGDFNRLWNFTALLFLGVGLYLFLARNSLGSVGSLVTSETPGGRLEGMREISQTALTFLRWLPFVLFPLVLIHAWSRTGTLPWSTFSLYAQARAARSPEAPPPPWTTRQIHPGHPYLAVVLLASIADVTTSPWFLPGFLLVLLGALWPWWNWRFGWVTRSALALALLGIAVVTQRGLSELREAWQNLEGRLLQSAGAGGFDQLRSFTSLGAVGQLKQSSRIILRIHAPEDGVPGLLREAAYSRFRGQSWSTIHREFFSVGAPGDGTFWRVVGGRRPGQRFVISRYTTQGEAPLPLPGGVLSVRDLPVANIETNYVASARLRDGPPLARYAVEAGSEGGFDGPPELEDTDLEHLGAADRDVIEEVGQQLGLSGMAAAQAVEAVERFFAQGFEYSLWQRATRASTNGSPLAVFLRESRAGHCEYFATATTLLLRVGGVPTRYAVGFSPERRRGEDWVARGRDAHAWCLAFVDGRWTEVDTTPGIWRERESAHAGWWEPVSDFFSQLWFRFAEWRQQGGNWQLGVFAAASLVLSWMAWRQLRGSRWRRSRPGTTGSGDTPVYPGLDSELFPVIRRLEVEFGPRPPSETLPAWIRRLGFSGTSTAGLFQEALQLHSRLRFDPRGLTAAERTRLRTLASEISSRSTPHTVRGAS